MKIIIENFGPVNYFEFDSEKPLHLIVGNNNVGKSYALTAYYFAVKTVLEVAALPSRYYYMHEFVDNHASFNKGLVEDLYSRIKEKKSADIDVGAIFIDAAKVYLKQTLADIFSQKIKSSYSEFDSIVNQFADCNYTRISFGLPSLSFTLEGNVDGFEVTDIEFEFEIFLRAVRQNRTSVYKNGRLTVYRNASEKNDDVLHKIRFFGISHALSAINLAVDGVADINYLPASRSGLYQALSAFGLIVAELSKNRSFISSRIELPGISGQLSDYFIKLAGITESPGEINSSLEGIAEKIESEVLKGKIEYDYDKKKLYYKPNNTLLKLDLSATSSMVSEVGPIVAYIRHIISNKTAAEKRIARARRVKRDSALRQILIIEEPEAHLHPENQIKMVELYAELANSGVNVIMTSHSNYVFNKVSNLVIAKTLKPQEVRCDLFSLTSKGSIGVSQDVDEFGIDDDNFVDASELLLNEKIALISNIGVAND